MKFSTPCYLYFVCPFTFTIDLISIDYGYKENNIIYYITSEGAYLKEEDLFPNLEEAKGRAFTNLRHFYSNKLQEILHKK